MPNWIATVSSHRYREPKVPNLRRRHLAGIISGFIVACALTVTCYWPSLAGPFLFDDIPNLQTMSERGGLTSFENYAEFITTGQSGPLGRPLSLASFALNGQHWPADPLPFRITNLVIHLVNGLLIFFLARVLFATSFTRETAEKLALLCVTIWLLHPLNVSTTAYIIQRMAQLATLFTVIGLLFYVHGRKALPDRSRKGWAFIVLGMGASGLLALLSKESGILLPFYALAIEMSVFAAKPIPRRQQLVLLFLLCAPILALISYIGMNWSAFQAGFDLRPFTMAERLLTQGVVLTDYLRQIVMPRLSGLGLFHDDFPVSRGLFEPVGTAASFAAISVMLFFAIRWRKTRPLISLGILWFFLGHSLEAGPLALELYFEHRNYLAMLGPLLLLCFMVTCLPRKLKGLMPPLVVLFITLESFLLWQVASPWGDEEWLMQVAVVENPDSLRAQQYAANQFIVRGNYPKALEVQETLAGKFPQHIATRLSILNLKCLLQTATAADVDATTRFAAHGDVDFQILFFLVPLSNIAEKGTCQSLSFAELHDLLDGLLRNPAIGASRKLIGAVHYRKGFAYRGMGDFDKALEQLELSYLANPEIDVRLWQVDWSLESGNVRSAETYLALATQHGSEQLFARKFRVAELEHLQQKFDRVRGLGAKGQSTKDQ